MSAPAKLEALRAPQAEFDGEVGGFVVQVVKEGPDRGALLLTPPDGEALEIRLEAGRLSLSYAGPTVRLEAPDGELQLQGRSVSVKGSETVEVHGGQEVDIHSGVDVEVRADHHVNLWGFGVNVGD